MGRSPFYARLLLIVWALGASLLLAWVFQSDSFNLRHGQLALLLVVLGVFATWSWRHTVLGSLNWDGQNWTWAFHGENDAMPVRLQCHLDLQSRVLLQIEAIDGEFAHWVWWERRQNPSYWLDARRALFSRARPPVSAAADQVGLLA